MKKLKYLILVLFLSLGSKESSALMISEGTAKNLNFSVDLALLGTLGLSLYRLDDLKTLRRQVAGEGSLSDMFKGRARNNYLKSFLSLTSRLEKNIELIAVLLAWFAITYKVNNCVFGYTPKGKYYDIASRLSYMKKRKSNASSLEQLRLGEETKQLGCDIARLKQYLYENVETSQNYAKLLNDLNKLERQLSKI